MLNYLEFGIYNLELFLSKYDCKIIAADEASILSLLEPYEAIFVVKTSFSNSIGNFTFFWRASANRLIFKAWADSWPEKLIGRPIIILLIFYFFAKDIILLKEPTTP